LLHIILNVLAEYINFKIQTLGPFRINKE
jgi:hypothetical protein